MLKHRALLTSVEAVQNWVEDVRAADRTRVIRGSLAMSSAWALTDGRIRHASGRFFNIVGLEWAHDGALQRQPFIEQREIGTLGFIARSRGDTLDLLVHAKAEPGNVGFVQLAPTCQATASNHDRVHGGELPPVPATSMMWLATFYAIRCKANRAAASWASSTGIFSSSMMSMSVTPCIAGFRSNSSRRFFRSISWSIQMRDPFCAARIGAHWPHAGAPAEVILAGLSGVPSIARRGLRSFRIHTPGSAV